MLPPNIPTNIICAILGVWLILFLLGREQYKRIKKNTQRMTLDNIKEALEKDKELTVSQYYEQINHEWEMMVPRTAKFILHRSELYPVPARLETVRKQMNFSPEWLGAFLRLNGYTLKATPSQQERIDYILSLSKTKQEQNVHEERRSKNS